MYTIYAIPMRIVGYMMLTARFGTMLLQSHVGGVGIFCQILLISRTFPSNLHLHHGFSSALTALMDYAYALL